MKSEKKFFLVTVVGVALVGLVALLLHLYADQSTVQLNIHVGKFVIIGYSLIVLISILVCGAIGLGLFNRESDKSNKEEIVLISLNDPQNFRTLGKIIPFPIRDNSSDTTGQSSPTDMPWNSYYQEYD